MKILHLLHRSLPGTHGYAIRSKYIAEYQKALGLESIVITSPFQSGIDNSNKKPEYINGIPYYRTNILDKIGSREVRSSSVWASALRLPILLLFLEKVLHVTQLTKPSVIHAHSPFYCGLIAFLASRILGIPYVYEIRGAWEASFIPEKGMSLEQKVIRFLETLAIKKADSIVVISEHLRNELLARGINKKINVVPNGVDTIKFSTKEKSKRLLEEYHLGDKIILGYIGTLSAEYEGLEYLIKAMPLIVKKQPSSVLLLVGNGRLKRHLERLSEKMSIKENVIFTGPIPHDMVQDYYSIIDICVFPRIRTAETELVTPLKPFEAMACGKAVIASDVGGMREIISEEQTGVLFEAENICDLAKKCLALIEDSARRALLGNRAREWVRRNRDWKDIVLLYRQIYENLEGCVSKARQDKSPGNDNKI